MWNLHRNKDDIEIKKLLSLSGSVLLKVLEIYTLVSLWLELWPGFWLAVSLSAVQPNMLANCSLVELLLYCGFNYE